MIDIDKLLNRIQSLLEGKTPFEKIEIRKSRIGEITRVTIHKEEDEYYELEDTKISMRL